MLKFIKKLLYDPSFQKKKSFLKSLEIFEPLRDRELAAVVGALHGRTYNPGEVLFVEGDIGRALFILESGKVELTKSDPSGAARPLYTVAPGEFFGEMALLEQLPRSATATASERSHIHLLYRSKLDELLHRSPRAGLIIMTHLARLLSNRLRRASGAPVPEALPRG